MPATVALLSVLGCTVAQAPGDGHDICSGPNEAIEYPHYMRPLMDSWNYDGLLSSNVWNQVSLDDTVDPRGQVSLYIRHHSLIPCFASTARILANLPRGMLLLVITIMNIIKI